MTATIVNAQFKEFSLSSWPRQDHVVVPGVRSTWYLKYGQHAYTFYSLEAGKAYEVTINHLDIVRPGWKQLKNSIATSSIDGGARGKGFSWLRRLFRQDFQYNFNLIEQVMLMTVPHTVEILGDRRFKVTLWSYFGFLEVDCIKRTVTYHLFEQNREDEVLGSRQWCDPDSGDFFSMTFSLPASLRRAHDSETTVPCRFLKKNAKTGETTELWNGAFVDSLHDIMLSKQRRYAVVCELGMHLNATSGIAPSKVMLLDLQKGREWIIEHFIVAAHAQFDPVEDNIVYFSSHNFRFKHSSIWGMLLNGGYGIEFHGDAAIYKYEITDNGPRELGVFTAPEFRRLTNFHCFKHRNRKVIVATSAPNFLYVIDAESMQLIKKIEVQNPRSWCRAFGRPSCLIGTIAPSSDGEVLYVQTNWSFQIVDLEAGKAEFVRDLGRFHSCSNHMASHSSQEK